MQIIKVGEEGVLFIPLTAQERNFLDYVVDLVRAKEKQFLKDVMAKTREVVPDAQPLTIW